MTYLDDIIAAYGNISASFGSYCVLKNGYIVFGSSMTGKTVKAVGVVSNPNTTINSIPERFQLAALYYVLHCWYAHIENNNKANYYGERFDDEWAKVKNNRLGSAYCSIGEDL